MASASRLPIFLTCMPVLRLEIVQMLDRLCPSTTRIDVDDSTNVDDKVTNGKQHHLVSELCDKTVVTSIVTGDDNDHRLESI